MRATKRSHTDCAARAEICWPTIDRASVVKASPRLCRRPSPKRGMSFFITRSRRDRCLQASSQKSAVGTAGASAAVVGPATAQAFTQVVPGAESLSTMPRRRGSSRIASAEREVARLLGGGALLDAPGDRRLVERRRPPAGRRAAPAAGGRARRRAPSAARRRSGRAARFTSAASSNSTAHGVGRVEVVVHRLAERRGARLDQSSAPRRRRARPVERGVEAAQRRCARRRGERR